MTKNVTQEAVLETEVVEPVKDELSAYDHKMIDNDIKFRGPLSYRHIRMIGWLMMSIMFVGMMLGFILKIKNVFASEGETFTGLEVAIDVLSYFAELPLPLFLIANFAIIIQNRGNYRKLLKTYGKILLIIYGIFIFAYYHYVIFGFMMLEGTSLIEARNESTEFLSSVGLQSGLVINVFVDLFCCVLIMMFLDYKPKKHFQGKKLIWFRLMVFLPILYEIGSAVLMGFLGMNKVYPSFTFSLPPEILPLIGKKPIGMIIAFVFICLFIKVREKHYLHKGGTVKGYREYKNTNRSSLILSSMMSVIFFVVALVDFLAMFIPILVEASHSVDGTSVENLIDVLSAFTIGKSVCLIFTIPFVMLFSYSKVHKDKQLDKFLPIIGIGLVLFAIIETLFFSIVL